VLVFKAGHAVGFIRDETESQPEHLKKTEKSLHYFNKPKYCIKEKKGLCFVTQFGFSHSNYIFPPIIFPTIRFLEIQDISNFESDGPAALKLSVERSTRHTQIALPSVSTMLIEIDPATGRSY
jgi:hypothetical protein